MINKIILNKKAKNFINYILLITIFLFSSCSEGLINLFHVLGVSTLLYLIAEQKVSRDLVNILIFIIVAYHLFVFAQKNGYIKNN